jgi:hypothetical protein
VLERVLQGALVGGADGTDLHPPSVANTCSIPCDGDHTSA